MAIRLKSRSFLFIIIIVIAFTLMNSVSVTLKNKKKGSATLRARETIIPKINNKEKKYLTYLPHSGLSNQRIELQNALIMAAILNRTLIIPPAFLGHVYNWNDRKTLMGLYEWLTIPKNFDQLCPDHHHHGDDDDLKKNRKEKKKKVISDYVYSSKCQHYHKIGMIQWSKLHDLEPLKPFISFQYMDTISLDYITSELGLNHQDDMYIYNETVRYQWRIFENKTKQKERLELKTNYVLGGRGGGTGKRKEYYNIMNWEQWKQRSEKLLYVGSVFGSSRLNMEDSHHLEIKNSISKVFHYRLDTLLGQVVQTIVNDYLGGKHHYLGTHFRMQNKPFRQYINKQIQAYHQSIQNKINNNNNKENHYKLLQPSFCRHLSSPSSSSSSSSSMINIFMATDHLNPRQSQDLQPWFDYYPCTITLNDIPEKYFQPLDSIVDLIHPKKSLRPFLMPIIDTMITANAYQVYLNPGSTFSGYIGQLHNAWSN